MPLTLPQHTFLATGTLPQHTFLATGPALWLIKTWQMAVLKIRPRQQDGTLASVLEKTGDGLHAVKIEGLVPTGHAKRSQCDLKQILAAAQVVRQLVQPGPRA